MKKIFYEKTLHKKFKVGDQVLMWNKAKEKLNAHHKFDSLCLGPYNIV